MSDRPPLLAHGFVVEIDGLAGGAFSRVELPRLAAARGDAPALLRLERPAAGDDMLVGWWRQARDAGQDAARSLTVTLPNPRGEPVMRWRIRDARPVALAYSPLVADAAELLIETIELACGDVDVEVG